MSGDRRDEIYFPVNQYNYQQVYITLIIDITVNVIGQLSFWLPKIFNKINTILNPQE